MERTSLGEPAEPAGPTAPPPPTPAAAPAAPPEAPSPRILPGAGRIRRETLDRDAVFVVQRLQRMGHEAYLVGGCVRDLLLGMEPKDFDVATDATPNRIKRIFRNAFVIGRRFRLVHVRFPGNRVVETATFRRDPGERGNHPHRPDAPIYDDNVFGTAEEDAWRRDFTVNALFYDPSRDEVVDYVDGLADLERRVIRSIGDPERRIKEDPVRMIRAVHFAARLGGAMEPSLREAVARCAGEISKASPSRLYVELMKILGRGFARPTLEDLHELGVLRPWLPELAAFLDRPIDWPAQAGGTHESAREGEPEDTPAAHLTWNLLGAADAWGLAARGVPESLVMAVLVGPWLLDTWARGPRRGPDLATHVEESFRPIALRMSIPRRVSYEVREILWMLGRLHHPPEQRRRLRGLVQKPVFPEALAYYGLELRARDRDAGPVEEWQAVADEVWEHESRHRGAPAPHAPTAYEPGESPPSPEQGEEGPFPGEARRPRRRRGRRGRGGERRGATEAAGTPPEAGAPPVTGRAPEPPSAAALPPPPHPPARPPRPRDDRPFGAGLI